MPALLSIRNLTKTYQSGNNQLTVLRQVSANFNAGSTNAIVGPSGSGKTTFLGLSAGLDNPTSGDVIFDGRRLSEMTEDQRATLRSANIGFVFQNFQLISTLTSLENIMTPLELRGERNAGEKASNLLEQVGLTDRSHHYPMQLSGGEKQRVALARAFINHPKILFADEPTGNLDSETSQRIEKLLFSMNEQYGTTLIMATHDLELANRTRRIIRMKGGRIESDLPTISSKTA